MNINSQINFYKQDKINDRATKVIWEELDKINKAIRTSIWHLEYVGIFTDDDAIDNDISRKWVVFRSTVPDGKECYCVEIY